MKGKTWGLFSRGSGRKRHLGLAGLLLVLAVALAACAQAAEPQALLGGAGRDEAYAVESMPGVAPALPPMAEPDFAVSEESMAFDTVEGEISNAQPSADSRLIIRTGDISVVVSDTDAALDQIAGMAESNGGWVVSSYIFQADENAKSGTITIRVPAEGFQSALDAISAMAVEVQSLSTSGQDVTEEYVDLDARLGNLEATADRVRAFMDEAETVEEALAVNQELSRLEGEIEVIKGRMKYLSESSAFSTITANLTPDILAQPVKVGGWQPVGVAKEALEALINGLQGIANVLIWLAIYVLPIALIIFIPLFFLVRYLLRRSRAHDEAAETAAKEQPTAAE